MRRRPRFTTQSFKVNLLTSFLSDGELRLELTHPCAEDCERALILEDETERGLKAVEPGLRAPCQLGPQGLSPGADRRNGCSGILVEGVARRGLGNRPSSGSDLGRSQGKGRDFFTRYGVSRTRQTAWARCRCLTCETSKLWRLRNCTRNAFRSARQGFDRKAFSFAPILHSVIRG